MRGSKTNSTVVLSTQNSREKGKERRGKLTKRERDGEEILYVGRDGTGEKRKRKERR